MLLASRLGNLVGQSLISYQNVEKALEEPRELVEEDKPLGNVKLRNFRKFMAEAGDYD